VKQAAHSLQWSRRGGPGKEQARIAKSAAGDRVSFQRIDRATFNHMNRAVEAGSFDWATR
jgi:hypothetical protein